MTTETTDPLEQAVMEAAADYAADVLFVGVVVDKRTEVPRAKHRHTRERLRLHVRLALAKARYSGSVVGARMGRPDGYVKEEIAALEARLQED